MDLIPGKLVKNNRLDKVGVLLKEQEAHYGYWNVLVDGEIVVWYANNLTEINNGTKANIRLSMV